MSIARHAGFASVTTVGAELVNGLLQGAASLAPATAFTLPSVVTVGGNSIGLSGSLTLNPPTVAFASNPQNLIGVTIGATGTAWLTHNGGDLVEVDVTLTTTVQVGLFVTVSAASLAIGIDLSNAAVTAVTVMASFGPPLATQYSAALQSSAVLTALTAAMRSIPKAALTFTLPGVSGTLSYNFSGVTVEVPVSKVTLLPIDGDVGTYPTAVGGCLNIALDVAAPLTSGNASQLVNLLTTIGPSGAGYTTAQFGQVTFYGDGAIGHKGGGVNLGTIVNADFFASVVNDRIAPQLSGLSIQSLTIEGISLSFGSVTAALDSQLPTVQFNCLTVSIDVTYSSISFTFDASFTPVRVEVEEPYQLGYSMWLVAYDLSSPFLSVLNVLLPIVFPWLGVIGDLIVDSTVNALVANNVSSHSPGLSVNGFGTLPFPGLSGWQLQYWIDDAAVSTSEISGYMAVKVVAPPTPAPAPVFTLIGAPHALTDPTPIPVTLVITRAGLMDPLLGLHVAWAVVRDDTGAVVLNQDTPLSAPSLAIAIERWRGDLIYNNTWTVTCEVYRPADTFINRYTYFTKTISVGVSDVVDRHHPYIHWDHTAWFHDPAGKGTLKLHGFWTRARKSRIHRTDLLIRCKALEEAFASGYPQETGRGLVELKLSVPTAQYLDSLSEYGSLDTVENWRRGLLCDYCFFGGPTRTTWKAPTPPTPPFV